MEWLSQNWIWVTLAIVAFFWLLRRGRHEGMMGGYGTHGMAHEGPSGQGRAQSTDVSRPPMKEEKAEQPAERAPSSHRHGRGGCC